MFKNPGKKIKNYAKGMFYCFVLSGIILASIYFEDSGMLSLLLIPSGFIIGWLQTIFLYSYGDLCNNIEMIANNLSSNNENHNREESNDILDELPDL